jgi:hypothetical protein
MGNPGIGFKNHTRDFGKVSRPTNVVEALTKARMAVQEVIIDPQPGAVYEVRDVQNVRVETGDGRRKDAGKDAGFWLLPPGPLTALAKVFKIGADKYSPRGWEAGMEWSRVVDPMFRHLLKWMRGEKYDQTDGQHHLSSVAWACFVLMEYEETHPEFDDLKRPS